MSLSNFSWVLKGKLAGCDLPGNGAIEGTALWNDIEFLAKERIRLLVSLEHPMGPIADICNSLNMQWYYFSIPDFSAPHNIMEFNQLINICVDSLSETNPVCVHCRAGIGRTGMVLACIYGSYMKTDAEKAINYIRSCRAAVETGEQYAFIKRYLEP